MKGDYREKERQAKLRGRFHEDEFEVKPRRNIFWVISTVQSGLKRITFQPGLK